MRTFRTIREARVALAGAPRPMGFVPTMGALHEGHAALVRRCRAECATVVASIFVNPAQFGPHEDFARYPRALEEDSRMLASEGTDLLFAPDASEMYPAGYATQVHAGLIATLFEGAERPGHFDGVCAVVLKLLHIVAPDRAYLGRKDAQQLAVLRRMARDLDLGVDLVPVDTVRDADGLALSSRNAYLTSEQRTQALGLWRGLARAREAWTNGERDPGLLAAAARSPGLAYDYCACVDPESFGAPREDGPRLLVAAIRMGGTRLIDNVMLEATI